jgi:hypothetical protein
MEQIDSLDRSTMRKLQRRIKRVKRDFSKVQKAEARKSKRRRQARSQQAFERSVQKLYRLVDAIQAAATPVESPKAMTISDEERNLIRVLYETIASAPDNISDDYIAQISHQGEALAKGLLNEIPTANMEEDLWEPDTGKCYLLQYLE